MHKGIYAIHDMEAKSFHEPMVFNQDVDAKRFFITIVNDRNTFVSKFPAEHSLVKVGTYDTDTGKPLPMESNEIIMLGSNAVRKEETDGIKK